MDTFAATRQALHLLVSGDAGSWGAIGTSLACAAAALAAAMPAAVALAYLLASRSFFGRAALLTTMQALLAMPTVAVGLVLYILLSRQGPLGALGLLFTPQAIVIGQFLIALPILVVFSHAALGDDVERVRERALCLGASRIRAVITVLSEARTGLLAAAAAGFGRIISEVGCALMVGGEHRGRDPHHSDCNRA